MLESLIMFMIVLIVMAFVLWGVRTLLPYLNLPQPVHQIVLVGVGVICLVILLIVTLRVFGISVGHMPRF